MRNLVIFTIFLIAISIFGTEFSKIVPKTSFLYISVNNPSSTMDRFKKTKLYQFSETDEFKNLEKKFMEQFPKMLGDEKIDKILPFFKQFLVLFDFPMVILGEETKISKEHPIDIAFISNQKDFNTKITPFLAIMMFTEKAKDSVKLEKQQMKGFDVTILRPLKNTNDYLIAIVQYEEYFIVTTSLIYMELLLSHFKTKSLPTFDKNEMFFSYKTKFQQSDIDFYLNLEVAGKYLSTDQPEMDKVGQILNIDSLKSIFATASINSKNIFETDIFVNGDLKKNPFIDALPKKSSIQFPPFIPQNINSVTAFSINLEKIFDALMKTSEKEDKERISEIQKSMDIDMKEAIFKNLGPDFFVLSDLINKDKERIVFITNIKKDEPIIELLKKVQFIIPDFRMTVTPYLDGKILSIEKDKDFVVGFKKGYLFAGDTTFVKELMQKISSPTTQFTSSNLYKKMSKYKADNQIFIGMEDGVFSFKSMLQTVIDKEKNNEIQTKKDTTDRQKKLFEAYLLFVAKELSKVSDEKLRKYIGDYFYEMKIDDKNITIKFIVD